MKKILAFLLAATLLSAMFVLPSAAANNVNYAVDFNYVGTAPVQDGVVKSNEYGSVLPLNTFSKSKDQFVYTKGHTKYTKWDFDFYAAWDANNLYLAWVVRSDIHGALPKKQLDTTNGAVIGDDYEGNKELTLQCMWMYSCVQLVLTPGNPTAADYAGNNNWLEVGFCELEDGTTGRAAWGLPAGVDKETISLDDWTAKVVRDDAAETTTYEIAIPWKMTGIYEAGTDKQFGLAYAVATQEQYYSETPAMIEWQDVILTGSSSKKANNCAIVTMKGGNVQIDTGRKGLGTQPADVAGKTQLVVDGVNKRIVGNDAVLFTNAKDAIAKGGIDEGAYNLVWTYNLLVKPTGNANEYEVVAAEQGIGEAPSFATIDVTDDMMLLAIHSDGTAGTDHYARRDAAQQLGAGTLLKTWEINLGGAEPDTKYLNSCFYVEKAVGYVDPEADVFGSATVDGKVEKDGDIAVYEAGEEDRVITAAEANLGNAYVLIFDDNEEAPKLVQLGQNVAGDITLPAGYKAMTFFYDDNNQANLALKTLYDGAIEIYASEEVADNGLRSIDPELGCPYALYYDVVDGVAEFWIPKTAQEETPEVSTPESSEAASSEAASSEASTASEGEGDEGGSNLGLIIGIIAGVLVLAGAGVAVFFILKKKKA